MATADEIRRVLSRLIAKAENNGELGVTELALHERIKKYLAEAGETGPAASNLSQYMLVVPGELSVGDDQTPWVYCGISGVIQEIHALAKTAPTGAALTIEIEKYNGSSWQTVASSTNLQIASGDNHGFTDTLTNTTISEGDYLRLNIDQVGSTVAGEDLVVAVMFNKD